MPRRRNGRQQVKLTLWIDIQLKEMLRKVSEARGEDMSDFVRRAIKRELARLGFLPEEEKKALGIITGRKADR